MRPAEYATAAEAMYGPNPLRERRGTFPEHWGPIPEDLPSLRRWVAKNALRDGSANGDPATLRAVVEQRREDPAACRERARVAAGHRMRRQRLLDLLRRRP